MNYSTLCLGNSRALNSFYTPYLNDNYSLNAINLAYNGLEMPLVDVVINEYLDRHSKPENVVIEISTLFNKYEKHKYRPFNIYSHKSPYLYQKIRDTDSQSYIINKAGPLYRYLSLIHI